MSRFTNLFQSPSSKPDPTPESPKVEKVIEKVVPITKSLDKKTKV